MPIEIGDLFTKRTKKVEISIDVVDGDDEKIVVTYSPDKYTLALHNKIQAATKEKSVDVLSDLLFDLLVTTDITEKGKPYPLTKESLERLGLPILMALSLGVQSDLTLGKASANGSSEG
jgi:hypothetical protein